MLSNIILMCEIALSFVVGGIGYVVCIMLARGLNHYTLTNYSVEYCIVAIMTIVLLALLFCVSSYIIEYIITAISSDEMYVVHIILQLFLIPIFASNLAKVHIHVRNILFK